MRIKHLKCLVVIISILIGMGSNICYAKLKAVRVMPISIDRNSRNRAIINGVLNREYSLTTVGMTLRLDGQEYFVNSYNELQSYVDNIILDVHAECIPRFVSGGFTGLTVTRMNMFPLDLSSGRKPTLNCGMDEGIVVEFVAPDKKWIYYANLIIYKDDDELITQTYDSTAAVLSSGVVRDTMR